MVFKRKSAAVFSTAAALALVLSACSSTGGDTASPSSASGGESSASSSVASGESSAATGSPVTIGVSCSCSGAFGTNVSVGWKVVQAWLRDVNARGGLGGHEVKVEFRDNGSDAAKALTAIKDIIAAKPVAIIDLDVLDVAWTKETDAAEVPVIGGSFTTSPYTSDPLWYPSGQTANSEYYSAVQAGKSAGVTKMAQLYCAESPQCQESVEPFKQSAEQLGAPVVYSATIAANAPNYTAQCVAAKQAGADGMFIGHGLDVASRVTADCEKQGYTPTYITLGTGFSDVALSAPGLKDRLVLPFPLAPYFAEDNPAVAEAKTVIDKYSPGTWRDSQKIWSEYALQAWAGGKLIEKAAELSGATASEDLTVEKLLSGLNSFKDEDLGGLTPPLTFQAGKPHPVNCWIVGRVKGGQPSAESDYTCQD